MRENPKRVKSRLYNWLQMGVEILFPPRCVLCDGLLEQGEYEVHKECRKRLYPVGKVCCCRCGRPVATESVEYCYDCSRKSMQDKAKSYREGKALYLYKGEIKQSMYRLKYSNKREYAIYFAREFEKHYADWFARAGVEVIVPVPMYWKKEQARGYNQAAVLAKALGRQLQLPVRSHLVRRITDTKPQKELNDIQRKNNLKNAFQTRENNVKYKKILLIDDIYTTGSTMEAVAQVLMAAGATEIYCLSVCIGEGA